MFDIAKNLVLHGNEIRFFSMKHPRNIPSEDSKYFVSYIDFYSIKDPIQKLKAFSRVLYSFEAKRKIEKLIKDFGNG